MFFYNNLDIQIALAPQRGANFAELNFQMILTSKSLSRQQILSTSWAADSPHHLSYASKALLEFLLTAPISGYLSTMAYCSAKPAGLERMTWIGPG